MAFDRYGVLLTPTEIRAIKNGGWTEVETIPTQKPQTGWVEQVVEEAGVPELGSATLASSAL